MGVGIQPLNEGLADSFGYHGTGGALIGDVSPGSPADKAGFKQGDIVIRYDDKEVSMINQLRNLVASTKPGKKVPVEVFCDGGEQTLSVKIGELSEHPHTASASESSTDLGLSVSDLTPVLQLRRLGVGPHPSLGPTTRSVTEPGTRPVSFGAEAEVRISTQTSR